MRAARAILWKDLHIEWRTRESISGLIALGVLLLVVFTIAHDPTREEQTKLAPTVLWATFVFTGLIGVQRSFLLEREQDCMAGLLMAPIDPAAIFVGKLAANLVLLGGMQAIVVPLVAILLHVDFLPVLPELLVVLSLGNLGFAAGATLFTAMAVRTRAREVLLPLLLLPLTVPVLIASVKATALALGARPPEPLPWLQLLLGFDVIVVATSFLVFEYILDE